MQTKNQISLIRKSLYGFMLLGIFFFTFGIGNFPTVRAQEATTQTLTAQTKVILSETPFISAEVQESKLEVTSTIPIPAEISASVVETLRSRPANILPGNKIIITSLDQNSGWALMTVAVQLENPNPEESILLNSAVVIAKSDSSGWTSAIMGTDAYEVLLTEVPAALVPAESKAFLSTIAVDSPNSLGSLAIGTSLRWPWASNARWTMTQKPHSWYGAGAGTDTSAIDFKSLDGNISVYAAAQGTIVRRCEDDIQREIVIRHTTGTSNDDVTGYLHIDKNSSNTPAVGSFVNAGAYILSTTIRNGHGDN